MQEALSNEKSLEEEDKPLINTRAARSRERERARIRRQIYFLFLRAIQAVYLFLSVDCKSLENLKPYKYICRTRASCVRPYYDALLIYGL
jgi:hypothetical protein